VAVSVLTRLSSNARLACEESTVRGRPTVLEAAFSSAIVDSVSMNFQLNRPCFWLQANTYVYFPAKESVHMQN
jgi:hypothetical protein